MDYVNDCSSECNHGGKVSKISTSFTFYSTGYFILNEKKRQLLCSLCNAYSVKYTESNYNNGVQCLVCLHTHLANKTVSDY